MNICEMCQEYSATEKCEYMKTCQLQKLLRKIEKLRKENKELKEKIDELEFVLSWDTSPEVMGE